jgi:UDPglucose--hexose-1-phosphate uridylyltransferase
MPELRKNELTGEWVSIAEERANRPSSYPGIGLDNRVDDGCPFCIGNEHMTGTDICRSRDGRIRVVANKYPILTPYCADGFGMHEVVIDTNRHDERLHAFSAQQLTDVLIMIRERLRALKTAPRIRYIQVFKNQGMMAGASQPHSHWQIVAMPVIPLMQRNIYRNALQLYRRTGKCYICDEIVQRNHCTDLTENAGFKAYCHPASKFSYEIQITPKAHTASFDALDERRLFDFADILKRCLQALHVLFPDLSYNICFMDACVNTPSLAQLSPCVHFYAQIIPRIGHLAGFEFSTSSYINAVPPEKAAAIIRQQLIF